MPLQKCKNTNTTVGLVGKKWAADEVLPHSWTNVKDSTSNVEWPTIQFCYIPYTISTERTTKAKLLTVSLLDLLLPVISKGMVSSVRPTSKMLLFCTILVLFLKLQLFLQEDQTTAHHLLEYRSSCEVGINCQGKDCTFRCWSSLTRTRKGFQQRPKQRSD